MTRLTLFEHGIWKKPRPYLPPAGKRSPDPKTPDPGPPDLQGEEDSRLYPFTKGLELANDGIGYGEGTLVTVRAGGEKVEQKRRRTRTGAVLLAPQAPASPPEALRSPPKALVAPTSAAKGSAGSSGGKAAKTRPAAPKAKTAPKTKTASKTKSPSKTKTRSKKA